MRYRQDLTGTQFGRLTVVARHKGKHWECLCSCGSVRVIASDRLKNGHTSSCGCLRREMLVARSTKHGNAKRGSARDPEYTVWQNMKRRCLNPTNHSYRNYGGRGITVHPSWVDDYDKFMQDMGHRPTPRHTLERIDNDGPYAPDNCKWATRVEQRHNQRQRRDALLQDGVPISVLAKQLGIPYATAKWRFHKYGRII
jgi:hypothetical protein